MNADQTKAEIAAAEQTAHQLEFRAKALMEEAATERAHAERLRAELAGSKPKRA